MTEAARHIDPGAVLEMIRQDGATVRQLAVAEMTWLSLQDVCDITGFGEKKVLDLQRRGLLPMVKIHGKWRITREAFLRAEREIFRKFAR